jgi:SAM-dependent methyltransferase
VSGAEEGLADLLRILSESGYRFATVTPETHRRMLDRDPGRIARDLRGVFGWNLPFDEGLLPAAAREALERSEAVTREGPLLRSRVRVATIGDRLFLHSAYPTDQSDAVFFGPDSYRYVRFLKAELPKLQGIRRIVDIGAGTGVGAIMAAGLAPGAAATATDINPLALRFARINARHAGIDLETVETSGLDAVEGAIDLVIANPPFVADPAGRLYRDGGGLHGAGLSLDWAVASAGRIAPGGAILLYTGSAIVDRRDGLREALAGRLPALGCSLEYEEIDPDIFGELLGAEGYEAVERVAAIGAVVRKA